MAFYLKEMVCEDREHMYLEQLTSYWKAFVHNVMNQQFQYNVRAGSSLQSSNCCVMMKNFAA
jgi:hypothetical protein